MGERPSRGGRQRHGRIRPRKTDTVSPVCVCGWVHHQSVAARPSAWRISSSAHAGTEAGCLNLRRRQTVPRRPGTGTRAASTLNGWRLFQCRVAPRSRSSESNRRKLLFQLEPDFRRYLPLLDFAILDVSAGFNHLEPSHVSNGLFRARQRILDRLFQSLRRGTDYLNLFVNMVSHTPIISPLEM